MPEDTAQHTPTKAQAYATSEAEKIRQDAGGDKAAKMHVKVYAPFKVYFDGEATSLSAANDTGAFDILPHHHNFMTLLSTCDIVIRTDRGEERIAIERGIMHVKADRLVVFLDV